MTGATAVGGNPINYTVNGGFDFFGIRQSQIYVSFDGVITFDAFLSADNVDLSRDAGQSRPSVPMIAALWDDLLASQTRWKLVDVDLDTQDDLVVEWTCWYAGDNTPYDFITFQAVLFANGNIRFNYKDIDSYPAYGLALPNNADGDDTVYKTGGINATVGIWNGTSDDVVLPAGKFVPGPHIVSGDSQGAGSGESNDSYVRMAWDTGGAAWDIGVVSAGINTPPANALRDQFIASLAQQIKDAAGIGKVARADDVLLAIDYGATSTTGSDGFTGDTTTPRVTTSATIDRTSNSIPLVGAPAAKVNGVFQHARTVSGSSPGDINLSFATLPSGAYIVELFFAPIPSFSVFDVLLEGKTVLNNYYVPSDRGRIIEFDMGGGVPSQFELDVAVLSGTSPAGTVKRFLVNVTEADADGNGTADPGLQIRLHGEKNQPPTINGLRILRADAPRVEDVVIKGTTWAQGVDYSYADVVPAGGQLQPSYLQGADTIEIHFTGPVTIPNGSLVILGDAGLPLSSVSQNATYNPVSHVASWSLSSPLPAGKYALQLSGVTGAGGIALDGDWMNLMSPLNQSATPDDFSDDPVGRTLLSGNGVAAAGETFEFFFSTLPGDYNQDGFVTVADQAVAADGNGDGVANASDMQIAVTNVGTRLPLTYLGGDYNDDEIVGEFDYMVWKMMFGATQPMANGWWADGSGDGTVNAADYTVWRNPLGTRSAWYDGAGSGGGAGVVPIVLFGEAPRVANVTISGSNSTHAPYSFDAHDGSGEQLRTVPVGAADTISITFTEDVNISAATLKLTGLRTANHPALADFSYDLGTMTATWRFTGWTFGDQYLISLSDAVTDVEGNALDGEWTNPMSYTTVNAAVSEFPSGDGTAGGEFNFLATLLPGDANLDGVVNTADASIIYYHWGYQNALFSDADFNGDGTVNGADAMIWNQNSGANLQNLSLLGDLNGDWAVDQADADILYDNSSTNLQNPTQAQGDLDGDGDIDIFDLDVMFAQFGLDLDVVS
jgi:hypothetical protein